MVFSWQLGLAFALAMAMTAIGFRSYIWFFSMGYGFSIAAIGLAMVILFPSAGIIPIICCLLLVVYGCRLGGYLLIRS